jgi:sterol desaturase/sphingolipid hydroxylase (fatty acid hydroxylase superfamily)
MPSIASVFDLFAYQFLRILNPRQGYCWIYLAGGLLFALSVMLWRRRGRARIRSRALLRLLGTRRLWLHRSTLLDVKLYFLHGVLVVIAYGMFEVSSELWRSGAVSTLTTLAGSQPRLNAPHAIIGAVTTLLQVLVLDLGYWALHYGFHKIPALWELHKVHHSAEVMTPLSEWRQHPIEFIAFANVLTLGNGAVYGAMQWLFGAAAQPFTLFEVNALFVLHLLTFHHMRHSGVWIAATGWMGRVFHSPAHHQIHHSSDPRHFDRNLGYALSLWDWAFGTLCIPERPLRLRFGVADQPPYRGLADTLLRPFAAGAARLHWAALPKRRS